METFIDLFSKLEFGIALLAGAWLVINLLMPVVRALRTRIRSRLKKVGTAITESVSIQPSLHPLEAERRSQR